MKGFNTKKMTRMVMEVCSSVHQRESEGPGLCVERKGRQCKVPADAGVQVTMDFLLHSSTKAKQFLMSLDLHFLREYKSPQDGSNECSPSPWVHRFSYYWVLVEEEGTNPIERLFNLLYFVHKSQEWAIFCCLRINLGKLESCVTCRRSHGKLGVKSAFDFQPNTWSTHVISVISETFDGGSGDKVNSELEKKAILSLSIHVSHLEPLLDRWSLEKMCGTSWIWSVTCSDFSTRIAKANTNRRFIADHGMSSLPLLGRKWVQIQCSYMK